MGADVKPRVQPHASKPVMVRISSSLWADLDAIARREESSVATVLRRLACERLEYLRREGRT